MRLPFLRSRQPDPPEVAPRTAPAPMPPEQEPPEVAAARTRARQRLFGALVLLALGVIGFPILLETQPRPLPVDTPIVLQRAEAQGGAVMPAPSALRSASRPLPAPLMPPADAAPEAASAPPAESRIASVDRMPAASAAGSAAGSAALPGAAGEVPASQAAASVPAPRSGRFTVQVGAFTDAAMLREARQKVEKLGLKTYVQVIENEAGRRTRVRVGPFDTREDADAAAARLKAAGLAANVLSL